MFTSIQSLFYWLLAMLDRRHSSKLRFALAQIEILKSKLPGNRVIVSPEHRNWLLSIAKDLDHDIADALKIVDRRTYQRWLREERMGLEPGSVGRPRKFGSQIRELVIKIALENPLWGIKRIKGELRKLSVLMGVSSVRRILMQHGYVPPPDKGRGSKFGLPWWSFIQANLDSMIATDFFCKDLWTLSGKVQVYCLHFIHLGTRRVWCSPVTVHPDAHWVQQQARNVAMWIEEEGFSIKYLIRDHDSKFTKAFDDVFRSIVREREGKVVKTSVRNPNMNAFAESFIGRMRNECLNHIIGVSIRQINYVIQTYIAYYNNHRPHQGRDIGNRVLDPTFRPQKEGEVQCRQLLGGLLKSYYRDAA